MAEIDPESVQGEYSDSDEDAVSSGTGPIRWIRDPSTMDRRRRGSDSRIRDPSIREYPSEIWVRPPTDTGRSSSTESDRRGAQYLRPASRVAPLRTPSTPRREQPRPAPLEVCQVPVDHQAGDEVDVPVTGDVPTGSVSAHQDATLSRGRSTVRNESQHENQSYGSSYCLPPVLAGPQSTPLTSTVGESPTTARGPSASPRKAAHYHSDTSKSTDGAAPNRKASKSPPKLADDDAFPGANAMSEIWPLYLEHARGKDKEMVSAWNTDLDAILIFAALFSAVLTTFIIESYSNLQADPTSEVLQAILFELRMARNASAARESPIRQFEVAASAVRVNVYWFSSLILSLATALITILAKQWVNYLLAGLSSIPADRARLRQYRIEGMHRWHLPAVLSFLPILLHVALLLFFAGLVDFVWDVNESVALIAAILVCTTSVVYIVANLLAYVYPDCPFKTSVTDFVVVVIDLLIVAYGRGRLAAMRLGRASARLWDRGVRACTSWYHCYQREDPSVEDGGAVPMTRIDTITSSETRNYEPLRITSLRRQGEQFIEENKTTMDAHILLWIMRHADRLREVQKLSNAIIHFPHLVLHRRLFIEKGAYGYLERLLQSSVSRSYSRLPKKRRVAVTSVMYALAVLEAEVAMDGVQDEPIDGGDTPNNTLEHATAPYTMIESSINPASSPLSPHTFPVIVSLLNEAHNLPFSVLASALRLSVRIPDSTVRGRVPSIKPIVHEFLVRVAQFQPPSGEHSDITHAVNTVIYLALHDASYPRRHGFVIPPIGDTRYWLDYLSRLVLQPFITPSARRQLCWAICALTPSLSVPPLGVIVKPRIPRIGRIHTMAGRLTALVSCDTDPSILRAALVALEGILWAGTAREEQSGVTFVAHLLRRVHLTFTTRLRRRLVMGQLQLSSDITAMTPSITRITIYLSIFHPKTTEHARVALLRNVFGILAHLLEASQEDPASLRMDMYACRSAWSPLAAASLRGIEARRWIYRAAGRIVTLLLNLGGTTRTRHTLRIDPRELIFTDNDDAPVAAALTLAFQSISGRMTMAATPGWTIGPLVLDSFAAIMKDIFVLGMRRAGSHPEPVDPEEVGIRQWDWEAPQVFVAHLAGRPGALSALLVVSSYDSTVRLEVLRTAFRAMCAVLHADTGGSGDAHSPPAISRHDSNHPATLLADMLRGQYQWVCQKLAEQIEGTHFTEPSMEGALIDFIRLSANLAFYRAPSDTSPDPVVLGNMVLFLAALLSRNTTSAAVRRHAWGTLGSIVAMCTQRMPEMRNDPDPERHFRFDTFDPEGIAVGLMRALALSSLETGIDIEPHCERCALPLHKCHGLPTPGSSDEDSPGGTSTRMPVVYKLIFSATLTAVVALWKADDDESVDVRGRLRQHGLASRLKPLLDLEESEAKWLTKEAMTKMFDAERDTPPDSLETPS